jgi:formylmethanofuran dehydrogenase subunit E
MGIITKEVEVKPRGAMIKHYKDKGYDASYNQSLVVNIKDLPEKSNVYLDILCDMCKENTMSVRYADYNRVVKNTGSYVCKDCSAVKAEQTNIAKYGKSFYF